MKRITFNLIEILSLPALTLLFILSCLGRGAHATGRFVTDTLDRIEAEVRDA